MLNICLLLKVPPLREILKSLKNSCKVTQFRSSKTNKVRLKALSTTLTSVKSWFFTKSSTIESKSNWPKLILLKISRKLKIENLNSKTLSFRVTKLIFSLVPNILII